MYRTIISSQQLAERQSRNPDHVKLLDCRARLNEPLWGAAVFAEAHLQGAQHADLDSQLAAAPGQHGRHPLPSLENWVAQIRSWGIDAKDQVVTYDDANGAFAARAWWMFRWAGHEAVAVLDGGINSWTGPLVSTASQARASVKPSHFNARSPLTQAINVDDVLNPQHTIVDARSLARWRGDEEPIDPVAGHIPGAVCLPFQDNLNGDGTFKSPTDLAAQFSHLNDPIVCYCGSGVTAAHNLLALKVAGRDEPSLFVGSWSEWIRDPARPIETC
jgi:thiosulfate/3-mercaptopyruvate sulfurtransferase